MEAGGATSRSRPRGTYFTLPRVPYLLLVRSLCYLDPGVLSPERPRLATQDRYGTREVLSLVDNSSLFLYSRGFGGFGSLFLLGVDFC